jgi:hypothetical protein
LDASSLIGTPEDIYLRNPSLLRDFTVRLDSTEFTVIAASSAASTGGSISALTLVLDGTPPANPSTFQVIPRFFRVVTNEVLDQLPSAAHIKLEFQGTTSDSQGNPVIPPTGQNFIVPWTTDIAAFNQALTGQVGFFRFRVEFDIGQNLSSTTPRPELEFLRIPFVF